MSSGGTCLQPSGMIGLAHIAVRDLESEDDGQDETKCGEHREDDDMLVAAPVEGHAFAHEFKETQKGPSSKEEEQGDKN